jgi:MYXO-CTERM domain-containing protein
LKEGATAVLTATVATGASGSVTVATGNVLFSAGSTGLGGVLLSSGSAVFDASALPVGASAITASYQGDSNYAPSMSASVSVTVLSTLAIAPQIDHVPPRGTVSFSATSGVPPIRWTLKTNASGGSIAASTGAYTAGAKPGAVDEVLATDKDGATANATVEIGAGVSIAPTNASTTSGGTIAFSASGGSGSGFQWSLGPGGSGGSINAATGAYRAGETGGTTDIVTVTDSLGNMSSVHVTVSQSTPSGSSGPSGAASPTGQTGPTTGGGGCSCGAAGAPGGLLETAALALLWMMALARRRHARR